jgi:glycosyltransferase involved in cell wall biosynthesis
MAMLKNYLAKQSRAWFAYTDVSRCHLEKIGVEADKINVVNNTVDSSAAQAIIRKLETKNTPQQHANNVGVFLGSLYKEREIPLLLEIIQQVHQRLPDFRFHIIGDGVERELVKQFCATNTWVTWHGNLQGQEKWRLLLEASFLLHPGPLGLNIIDAFLAGLPVVTKRFENVRSPEEAYLRENENALFCENSADKFAQAVYALLNDNERHQILAKGCRKTAEGLTIENMVENFARGIIKTLRGKPA